jgi:hypothetical protein
VLVTKVAWVRVPLSSISFCNYLGGADFCWWWKWSSWAIRGHVLLRLVGPCATRAREVTLNSRCRRSARTLFPTASQLSCVQTGAHSLFESLTCDYLLFLLAAMKAFPTSSFYRTERTLSREGEFSHLLDAPNMRCCCYFPVHTLFHYQHRLLTIFAHHLCFRLSLPSSHPRHRV